uniref:BED-type domain-containing protein n=1 Tax=Poecilia reticulata TaxID=8081 RepID=A0A3P9QCL5_POERE
MRTRDRYALSRWKYRNYFEFLSVKDSNIEVRCTLCAGQKVLSTFKNTTSNLRKHLESQHGTVKLMEVLPGGSPQRAATGGPPPLKQQKLNFGAKLVRERELKQLIGRYVAEEMMPLSTADSPSFRAIVNRISTTVDSELNLKAALKELDFVSTTADIWTANANNRSCMGVTLHWIHRATLEHALACRRIRGRHTYDVLGAEIENIHSSHGLLNKVVATVMDNGSNFVKAFKVFQPSTRTDDDVTFLNLTEILSAENEGDGQPSLPPHHRCASHTINIITTSDVEKYLTSHAESKTVYRSSIAKCTALWTKSCRSTLASEAVEEVSKRKFLVSKHQLYFQATKTRFAGVLDDKEACLAAVSCPKFKLRWLRDADRRERVKERLVAECRQVAPAPQSPTTTISQGEMDFFTFEPQPEESYCAEQEVMDYLRSAYDLEILHRFPNIKNIFLKYNTPAPSSAPVERLFSLGGITFCLVLLNVFFYRIE